MPVLIVGDLHHCAGAAVHRLIDAVSHGVPAYPLVRVVEVEIILEELLGFQGGEDLLVAIGNC